MCSCVLVFPYIPLSSLFVVYKNDTIIFRVQSLCQELKRLSLRTRTLYSTASHRSPSEPSLANMWGGVPPQNIQKHPKTACGDCDGTMVAPFSDKVCERSQEVRSEACKVQCCSSILTSTFRAMMQKGHFYSSNRQPDCLESASFST